VQVTAPSVTFRPVGPDDAASVHDIYCAAPTYFDVLSIPLPTVREVRTELETAAADPRRNTELVLLRDASAPPRIAGYLDVTLHYLEPNDATVNLLLVREDLQGRGIGSEAIRRLEDRLVGRVDRVLASVYGKNPRAQRFWRSLGYAFAIDAAPVLEWYAKRLHAPAADDVARLLV